MELKKVGLVVLITLTVLLILAAWLRPPQTMGFKNISVQEFDRLVKSDDPFILDVHSPEQKHIPGTDAVIDFTQIKENIDKLPEDKNRQILVYCRSGSMSLKASQDLVNLGYSRVKNLTGGLNAWKESHYGQQLMDRFEL